MNSVQKVWCAKFAARHPNVAVLDLSSFKCGHDAPTYGLVDSIIGGAGTPYSALHDIDANKPAGSIKIRVKTYTHTLKLHKERLEDLTAKQAELHYRIEEKRLALLQAKERQVRERTGKLDAHVELLIREASERMAGYAAKANRPAPAPAAPKDGLVTLDRLRRKREDKDRDDARPVDLDALRASLARQGALN